MPIISRAYVELRKSSNLSGDDMLGDTESSTVITPNTVAFDGSGIAGVTLLYAHGFDNDDLPVSANLDYVESTDTFTLTLSGESAGPGVVVSEDGRYEVPGEFTQYVIIDVTYASLPGSDGDDDITISLSDNTFFPDMTGQQAFDGRTDYSCVYIHNAHGVSDIDDVDITITQAGNDTSCKIGADTNGAGDGTSGSALAIADRETAPAGVTFSSIILEDLGIISPGDSFPIWIERTVPQGTTGEVNNDYIKLSLSITVS